MRFHSPSMSELHAFLTTARLGSFTKAAAHLCVTQGAVSRAIARLETHFGQPLMTRHAQGLSLTTAGKHLLEGTQASVNAIESVSAELRLASGHLDLDLAVIPTFASVWLLPRLAEFHQRHPEISLSFSAYRRDEDFSRSTPHAAILSGVPEQWPHWQCDYVVGKEVVVICHPKRLRERRAQGRWREPFELLEEPLLYHANAPGNWQHWFEAMKVAGKPRRGTTLDQVSIIIRAVMADMGVAVLQRCLVRDDIDAGRVAAPFEASVSLDRGYVLCSPMQRKDHPALSAFRAWILEVAAREPTALDLHS